MDDTQWPIFIRCLPDSLKERKLKAFEGGGRIMRSIMMVSFITSALIAGQSKALAGTELTLFVPWAAIRPVLQIKTGSISGVVTDPNSHAVAGVTLTALLRDENDGSTLNFFSTVSDSKGCFRFAALPIGTYEIRVGSDELIKQFVKRVVVRGSENITVEFQLRFIDECNGNISYTPSISDSDRAEIVKWMVEEAITEKNRSSGSKLASDRIVVLSTENIESSWIPVIPGYKLLRLTPVEVQQKANRQGDYLYWRFDKIRIRGLCVAVTVSHVWAAATSSMETGQRTLLGERLFIYVFRKQSGKWIGKFITGTIS